MTKYGIKLWSINHNLLQEAKSLIKTGLFHYIELMVVPNTEIFPFLKIKVPYIIHITSERWGVNIADKKKKKFNLNLINQCIGWADTLGAKYLILHPGFGLISNALEFLEKINDKRILIENMPKVGMNNEKMVGFLPEQIKKLTKDKFGFCLDFNHANKAAISLKKNYKKYVEDFLKLNPEMFHISDGTLDNEKDKHLNIGAGKYDFNFLEKCLAESNIEYVTMETPKTNLNSLEEDLKNIKKLKSFFAFGKK